MKINNYYLDSTGKITGFVYDTEAKTYKDFVLEPDEWSPETIKLPSSMEYFFPTLGTLNACQKKLKTLGFVEDNNMQLSFA